MAVHQIKHLTRQQVAEICKDKPLFWEKLVGNMEKDDTVVYPIMDAVKDLRHKGYYTCKVVINFAGSVCRMDIPWAVYEALPAVPKHETVEDVPMKREADGPKV